MDNRDSIDDEVTLVSNADSEKTLLPEVVFDFDFDRPGPCYFFNLPIEIRKKIYRFFCISDKDRTSHPRLWRPTGYSQGWGRIGYFGRGTVIPLLSLCQQIHDEAAAVLYGENLFAFHVSELSQGPIHFFSWLAPRYVRLLRRVHIRSGFNVDTYDQDHFDCCTSLSSDKLTTELIEYKIAKNLVLSAGLVKQAWPKQFDVYVNKFDTLAYSEKDDLGIRRRSKAIDWPTGSYHLWKMTVTDKAAEGFRPEFRRTARKGDESDDLQNSGLVSRSPAGWSHD